MPDIPGRAEFERKLAAAVGNRLNGHYKQLVKFLGDPPSLDNVPPEFWRQMGDELSQTIRPQLERVFNAAGDGIRFSAVVTPGVDWTLINKRAAEWAKTYTYELIKGINENTQKQVSGAVSSFFEDKLTIGDLRDALNDTFGPRRAALIASTEVTRAAVSGELSAVNLIEATSKMKLHPNWQTSEDDRVCDICGPRDGTTPEEGNWSDDFPPAHPGCRCWTNWTPEGWE